MNNSALTFGEICQDLPYIKVLWNGVNVYDDNYIDTIEEYQAFKNAYKDKIVYEFYVKIVEFHHCILEVEGEE